MATAKSILINTFSESKGIS